MSRSKPKVAAPQADSPVQIPIPASGLTTSGPADDPFKLVIKSHRYLSDWNDNVLQLDLRDKDSSHKLKPFTIDLATITVNLEQGSNVQQGIVPLSEFPHFMPAIKLAVHERLCASSEGIPANDVTSIIWTCQRLITYLLRNSIPRLSSVQRTDVEEIVKSVETTGWFETLDVASAIANFLKRVELNPELGRPVLGKGHAKHQTINPEQLAKSIGIFIPPDRIPLDFREKVTKLSSKRKTPKAPYKGTPKTDEPAFSVTRVLVLTLNSLSMLPEGIDSIPFVPFHTPSSAFETPEPTYGGNNFPIGDAVKTFDESLRWLYDHKPVTIQILRKVRELSLASLDQPSKSFNAELDAMLQPFKKWLADAGVTGFENYSNVNVLLNDLQKVVFSATSSLIACNHGRRMPEIIGANKNYGLYVGCITREDQNSEDHRIELYIQKKKNARAWFRFWCNEIIRDSVSFVEEIANELREADAEPLTRLSDDLLARGQRLFRMRSFPEGLGHPPSAAFEWATHNKWFLERTGVNLELFRHGPPPFRRMFISLYMHRFEFNELLPLHRHIRHTSLTTLVGYGSDSAVNDNELSLASTIKAEPSITADLAKLLQGAAFAYLEGYVLRMIRGEAIGGGFARLIHDFAKVFILNGQFSGKTAHEQAHIVTIKLAEEGYMAHEKETGPCTASNLVATAKKSKCYYDGEIHPDEASPKLCCGCVHSSTSPEIRKRYANELDFAAKVASNFKLPAALRRGAAKTVASLEKIIAAERRIASRNQRFFATLTRRDENLA